MSSLKDFINAVEQNNIEKVFSFLKNNFVIDLILNSKEKHKTLLLDLLRNSSFFIYYMQISKSITVGRQRNSISLLILNEGLGIKKEPESVFTDEIEVKLFDILWKCEKIHLKVKKNNVDLYNKIQLTKTKSKIASF